MHGFHAAIAVMTRRRLRLVEHVTVTLAPGRVIDLGDDAFNVLSSGVKAIIKTHRIKTVTKVTQMRQQSDRPQRPLTTAAFHQITHRLIERLRRITQIIGAHETRQCSTPRRP